MKWILIAVLCIAVLTVTSMTHAETKNLELRGPWLWTIVPTSTNVGVHRDAPANLHPDFLSLASDGAITEADILVNPPKPGDTIGESEWRITTVVADGTLGGNFGVPISEAYGHEGLNPYALYGLIKVYYPPDAYQESHYARSPDLFLYGDPLKFWVNGGCHAGYLPRGSNRWISRAIDLEPGENLILLKVLGYNAHFQILSVPESVTIISVNNKEDVNGDGEVTLEDVLAVAAVLGQNDPDADIDSNGIVEMADVLLVANAIRPPEEDAPAAPPSQRKKLKPWAAFKRR